MNQSEFWKNISKKGAVLDPVDRISEVLFGLIMAVTFTGAISVSTSTPDDVRQLLWAAMGCNFAWGLVDGIMNLMSSLLERGHNFSVIRKIKKAPNNGSVKTVIADEISPLFSELLSSDELLQLAQRVQKLPEPPTKNLITGQDIISLIQIFLLVFICTLPIALPFAFVDNLHLAMRISNGIALIMLFSGGYTLARYAGFRPLPTAISYTALGLCLVALTMALGG
jgi:VIT1/CCC1 family predicted Fe2+/Mn2+ transporter